MSCFLTVTLHTVDVRLTCLINITYLLTYLHPGSGLLGGVCQETKDLFVPVHFNKSERDAVTTLDIDMSTTLLESP